MFGENVGQMKCEVVLLHEMKTIYDIYSERESLLITVGVLHNKSLILKVVSVRGFVSSGSSKH